MAAAGTSIITPSRTSGRKGTPSRVMSAITSPAKARKRRSSSTVLTIGSMTQRSPKRPAR